jgi:hypothetical protein
MRPALHSLQAGLPVRSVVTAPHGASMKATPAAAAQLHDRADRYSRQRQQDLRRQHSLSAAGYTLSDSSADTSLILGTAAYNTSSKNVGSYAVSTSGLYSGQQGYDISYVRRHRHDHRCHIDGQRQQRREQDLRRHDDCHYQRQLERPGQRRHRGAESERQLSATRTPPTGKTVTYTSSLSGSDAGNYVLASAAAPPRPTSRPPR